MKSGHYPKCNSANVYKNKNGLVLGGQSGKLGVFAGGFSSQPAACDNYICVDCGYFESYIVTPERLDEVRQKWAKVE